MESSVFGSSVMSPYKELISYEYLWSLEGSSFKKIAEQLTTKDYLPSEIINSNFNETLYNNVKDEVTPRAKKFSVMFKENFQYPKRLLKAKNPLDMFYYKGNLDILETKSISIIGSRNMTYKGSVRAYKASKELCKKYTIVSGLASGVDTIALTTAIKEKGNVIAVIGTPIDRYYPKENKELQDYIAMNHLLISGVPLYKYDHQSFDSKKAYFPQRNITMAALSDATLIIEASQNSGTLYQAKACMELGKKLFILNSCFENPNISWPYEYLEKGAYRISSMNEIFEVLDSN